MRVAVIGADRSEVLHHKSVFDPLTDVGLCLENECTYCARRHSKHRRCRRSLRKDSMAKDRYGSVRHLAGRQNTIPKSLIRHWTQK